MAYSSARDNPGLSETLQQASGSHGKVSFHSSRPSSGSPPRRTASGNSSVRLSASVQPESRKGPAANTKRPDSGAQRTAARVFLKSSARIPAEPKRPAPKPAAHSRPAESSPERPKRPVHQAKAVSPENPVLSKPEPRPESKPEIRTEPEKVPKVESKPDPAIPQATPVTGHFNIVCLTAMGYNRLIDLLLREANYYDQLGGIGKEATQVMENMVYTFSHSSSKFTALDGSKEVLLTIMDEDFTNILGILLKAAYSQKEDPSIDYSEKLPYAGA